MKLKNCNSTLLSTNIITTQKKTSHCLNSKAHNEVMETQRHSVIILAQHAKWSERTPYPCKNYLENTITSR